MKNPVADLPIESWAVSWISHWKTGLISALFVFLYYPTLAGLVSEWSGSRSYSHGFLIPLISIYLIWTKRGELRKATVKESLFGVPLFILGLATLLLGFLAEEAFLQRISLPVTLLGLTWLLAGSMVAGICSFPVLYLLLMIPFPYTIYRALALKLRLWDSEVVASITSWLGIPLYRDGYFLHLPAATLEVADACSGFFSILSLFAIGVFYVYQLRVSLTLKVVLSLLLMPIGSITNIIRIATLVLLVHYSGLWALDSTFHHFSGTFNFIIGFSAILIAGRIVEQSRRQVPATPGS